MIDLLPYQLDGYRILRRALTNHDCVALNAPTGYGKTYLSAALAQGARVPVGVVCPKSVIPTWEKVLKMTSVPILFVRNYERFVAAKLHRNKKTLANNPQLETDYRKKVKWQDRTLDFDYGSWKIKRRKWQWNLPDKCLLIFDEAHRMRERKAQASKLLIAAKAQGISTILASATLVESPAQMFAIGLALGMHHGNLDYDFFLAQNGCRRGQFGGVEFYRPAGVMDRLNSRIFPDMGYTCSHADLPEFPENQVEAVSATCDKTLGVNRIYKKLEELAEKKIDDDPDNVLTEQLRLRQEVELYKTDPIIEMAKDALSGGNSVVVFVNFRATLDVIEKAFHPEAVQIVGGQNKTARSAAIDRFQSNDAKILISMIQAGGAGIDLHDLNGRPRVSIISPGWSATELIQALGRIHRAGSRSPAVQRIVTLAKTVEDKIAFAINRKVQNIGDLNDQDLLVW